MGRPNRDLLLSVRFDPAVQDAPAGENERVWALLVDHGQLQVPVERGGCDRLPHSAFMPSGRNAVFDPDQNLRPIRR
jgi:hypothetical protein